LEVEIHIQILTNFVTSLMSQRFIYFTSALDTVFELYE